MPAIDFRITPEVNLGRGGEAQKVSDNMEAIRTLKALEAENRRATPAEQAILARYVGWGGLANAFPDPTTGEFKEKWKERGEALRELLTPTEYRQARRSTTNAHYTSEAVVSAMWAMARRLGYRGGVALETSAGTGNFLGLRPSDLPTRFIAIEYDSLTARIAGALYPQQTVVHAGFHKMPVPDNAFDLNIGNPPFGNVSLRFQYRPELAGVSIHNQFFRAALKSVRPGGLSIQVVSRFLMDAQDKDTRMALAREADLVAAVRLPDSAFKENARTEVVTDIIVLRKLTDDEKRDRAELFAAHAANAKDRTDRQKELAQQPLPAWVATAEVADPLGGKPMVVNRYFADNPKQVLGVLERSGSMQFENDITVRLPDGQDLEALLKQAADRLPANVMRLGHDVIETTERRYGMLSDAMRIAAAGQEPGSVTLTPDGALVRVFEREDDSGNLIMSRQTLTPDSPFDDRLTMDGQGRWYSMEVVTGADGKPVKVMKGDKPTNRNVYERKVYEKEADVPSNMRLGKTDHGRLVAMVGLRDLLKRQLMLEADDAPASQMEGNREKLRAAYEAYVAKEGPVGRRANASLAMTMPDGALILSLEESYEPARSAAQAKRSGMPEQAEKAVPAPILRRRVVPKYEPPAKAGTLAEALTISLAERGVVDLERMASLLGVEQPEIVRQLREAEKPLAFLDPETDRWESAEEYLTGQVRRKLIAARAAGLEANARALEAVQPEPVGAENIGVPLGSTWVPPDVYAQFAQDLVGGKAAARFSQATNTFSLRVDQPDGNAYSRWSTEGASFEYLLERGLNSQSTPVYTKDADGNRVLHQERTEVAGLKLQEIRSEFEQWVFKDAERRDRLVAIFNEKFNTRVAKQFDGSHLTLPGKVPDSMIAMRRHQKNAIWRGIRSRFLLLDHVVGAGKAQPLDAKLLTPAGWKTMGEIQVGDQVISADGTPTRVEAIFPQGEKPIFRVTFSDGSSTECCEEHLWLTQTYRERGLAQRAARAGKVWPAGAPRVRSLAEIRATLAAPHLGAKNHSIPMVAPVQFDARPTAIDPYLMGVLLGDGCFRGKGLTFSSADRAIVDAVAAAAPAGCEVVHIANYDYAIRWRDTVNGGQRHPVIRALRDCGAWGLMAHEKHVPIDYMMNTVEARVAVLQGLMDTDGWCERGGHSVYFATTSERLASDVTALVQSLGGTVSRTEKQPTYEYEGVKRLGRPAINLCICLPASINPFRLDRKAALVKPKTRYAPARYIVGVEPVGRKPAQCIRVAHESRLYVTDDFIVTHNTYTGIARAMERRRMGLAKKPVIVVPNHLVEQWAADVYKLYPGAKVLAAGQNDFEPKRRRQLFSRIATGDWDIVIVPHSSFGFIGISPETEQRYLDEYMAQAVQALKEAVEQAQEDGWNPKAGRKPVTVKQAENLLAKLQERMDRISSGVRDRLLTFEQLGIDDLTVDEAHEFKNLFYSTKMDGKVRGMGDKSGSRKAADLYNKIRVLRETGGAVTFMTGTPISNSAVELYTILRYLAADELAELGLEHFDAWRAQSVDASSAFEADENARLVEVTRLGRQWMNMRSLMELYYSVTDAVNIDDIKKAYAEDNPGKEFPIPKVKTGDRQLIKVPPTENQARILQDVLAGFDGLKSIKDPKERNATRLRLMDRARKVSLDARILEKGITGNEEGGKLDAAAKKIKAIYDRFDDVKGTQLVFMDRGVTAAKGDDKIIAAYDALVERRKAALAAGDEDAYQEVVEELDKYNADEIAELRTAQAGGWTPYQGLKDNLIAEGIPADQIRFVQEANNDEQKQALFQAVREGRVRVLIGSTPRMGAGTNVQDRLVALHHMDVTWKPSDIEQREGRIVRQGNLLATEPTGDRPNPLYRPGFEVEIFAYATERTVDAKMWDLNATKLRMINALRKYDGAFEMEFDDEESASMAEIAAFASGSPLLVERVKLGAELRKLDLLRKSHTRRVQGAESSAANFRRSIEELPRRIEAARALQAEVSEKLAAVAEEAAARTVTVEGKQFARGQAVAAINAADEAIALQRAGDEKARFSIVINGQRVTTQDDKERAILSALGDQEPFVAEMAGQKYTRVADAARDITRAINAAQTSAVGSKELPAGSMMGYRLSVDVATEADRYNAGQVYSMVSISLMREDGSTVVSTAVGPGQSVQPGLVMPPVSSQSVASALKWLAADLTSKSTPRSAENMEQQLERAKRDLPGAEEASKEPFAKADELQQKQARLVEVIKLLQASNVPGAAAVADDTPAMSLAELELLAEPVEIGGPAAPADAEAAAKLTTLFQGKGDAFADLTFTAQPRPKQPPPGAPRIERERFAAMELAERMFGRRIVYFRTNKPMANGVVSAKIPGFIFVAENASKPVMAVIGHELVHSLKNQDEALYRKLADRVGAVLQNTDVHTQTIMGRYRARGLDPTKILSYDKVREELIADIVGDFFTEPEFWRGMAQGQPKLFARVLRLVQEFFDRLLGRLRAERPFGTQLYLSDISRAREVVTEVMQDLISRPAVSASAVNIVATGLPSLSLREAEESQGNERPGLARRLAQAVHDATATPDTFNRWWHDTVGTQFHKAQISPLFKRTFDAAQDYLHDISAFATRAADLAPTLLPPLDSLKHLGARLTLSAKDRDAVSSAVFKGTLQDRVFDDDELKAMGLDERQVVMYRQARLAINKSLDQLVAAEASRLVPEAAPLKALIRADALGSFRSALQAFIVTEKDKADAELATMRKQHQREKDALYRAHQKEMLDLGGAARAKRAESIKETAAKVERKKMILPAGALEQRAPITELRRRGDGSLFRVNAISGKWERVSGPAVEAEMENMPEGVADLVNELNRMLAQDPAPTAREQQAAERYADARRGMNLRQGQERYRLERELEKWEGLEFDVADKYEKVDRLKENGYAPLMRFGRYTATVRDEDGEVLFFGMYESKWEMNRAARRLRADFAELPGEFSVETGSVPTETWKLFRGVSPETIAIFGEAAGMDDPALAQALQAYYRLATSNQSALKRLIQRKKVPGFSEDVTRVLAAFITSNARRGSGMMHFGEMKESVEAARKARQGDIADHAARLVQYVQDPTEEAAQLKSLMFIQFLGGSLASALVNMTQPLSTTWPYLSSTSNPAAAAWQLKRAMATLATPGGIKADSPLGRALKKADDEGVTMPQEMHDLQAEATRGLLDVLPMGRAAARRFLFVWGFMFSRAEMINRRITFVAAYNTATKMTQAQLAKHGAESPYQFAANAVDQTQFVYNKANRPRWARGAVGGLLMTFKTYSVSYVELFKRMPAREKALMMATMIALAGLSGLPFAEDVDDIVDAIGQRLGYDTNVDAWKKRVLNEAFGDFARLFASEATAKTFADQASAFTLNGFSGLAGVPVDVSGRLSMGNLIPATGLFRKDATSPQREIAEVAGPFGSWINGLIEAARGDPERAFPVALANVVKAADMLETGYYRDRRNAVVVETTPADAAWKAVGLQPRGVAQQQRDSWTMQRRATLARTVEGEIAGEMAEAMFKRDREAFAAARQKLEDWNRRNPNTPIKIEERQIIQRLQSMQRTRQERLIRQAPPEMRRQLLEERTPS